jgi:LacI family transcriptional regulator
MAATIRDVARAAGVSVTTVSLTVNGKGDRVGIAADTRRRVLECARTLGYVADPRVRALRRGRTRTVLVAFVARQVPDEFFVDVLHALDGEAASRGRDTQFLLLRPEGPAGAAAGAAAGERPWDALRGAAKAAAGVVLVGSPPADAGPPLPAPLVQIGSGRPPAGAAVVQVDNRLAGRLVAEHLLGLGHRRVAILGPRRWYPPFGERREGLLQAFAAAGAPPPVVLVAPRPDGETVRQLRDAGVTAVACLYDRLALELLRAARLAGVPVPGQWSVAGFDDMTWSALLAPALTTVRVPRSGMAAVAMARLEALLAGAALGAPEVLAPELVVRESTAPPLIPARERQEGRGAEAPEEREAESLDERESGAG